MTLTHNTAPTLFIEASGVRYAHRRFGAATGVPLVFLQHFRGGLDNWDPLVTDGLAATRPVILFNNAGVASSGGEPADSVAGMAAHVLRFLDAMGLKQVDVLGFSLGGFVAQQLAADAPTRARRLILAGTGPRGGEGMDSLSPDVLAHATTPESSEEDFLYLFFAPSETSRSAGRAFWSRRHERKDQDLPSSPAAMQTQGQAIAAWGAPAEPSSQGLDRIRQPTLVVNGHNDIMVPTINSFRLQQGLRNATLILYPDSGHGALFQYARQFVRSATDFLNAD